MVPPLLSPNHPAIQDRLHNRQQHTIVDLERQGRYTPLGGYTVEERYPVAGRGAARLARDAGRLVAREEARQQGQREGYVQAMNDYGPARDGRHMRSTRSEVGSETSRTQNAYEEFMHHKDRKEHYGREVEDAHRRREREIEDRRCRMSSPGGRRSTTSEVAGYREEVEYRRRVEDHRPGQTGGFGYEGRHVHRLCSDSREPAAHAYGERYYSRRSGGYERPEEYRQFGNNKHRNEYFSEEG